MEWIYLHRVEKTNIERVINIHIEKQPEGVYLATSEEVQGLVAQGRTVTETLEIARNVARKLLEAQSERQVTNQTPSIEENFLF